jgi:hypothetical protein
VSEKQLLHGNTKLPQILDGQCCHIHPTFLTSHHEIIIICGPFKKDACKDKILPITRNSNAMHQRLQGKQDGQQISLGIGIYALVQR